MTEGERAAVLVANRAPFWTTRAWDYDRGEYGVAWPEGSFTSDAFPCEATRNSGLRITGTGANPGMVLHEWEDRSCLGAAARLAMIRIASMTAAGRVALANQGIEPDLSFINGGTT